MATISFAFPDDSLPLVTAALCDAYGYQATLADPANPGQTMPNPQTPGEFAQGRIVHFVANHCRAYLVRQNVAQAQAAAQEQAAAQVDALIPQVQVSVS